MQRGSMQGSGSSRELARPRGEGGLRPQDRLPFPSGTLRPGRGMLGDGEAGEHPKWALQLDPPVPRCRGGGDTRPRRR